MINDYENFLINLNNQTHQEVYARITSLTFQEEPIEAIEGIITQGSVNIDGNSIIRRSCNLTLSTKKLQFNDFYWGVKTKFKLEIGLKNNINKNYPSTMWFSQGIFVITSFNTNQSNNSYTISIQGKDKMCLLNGDLGGLMPMTVDLGLTTDYKKIPIKDILIYSLQTYAQEPYHNIIIKDLDETAVELLEYKGNQPLYLLRNKNTDIFTNYTSHGTLKANVLGIGEKALEEFEEKWFDTRIQFGDDINSEAKTVIFAEDNSKNEYTIAKLLNGEAAGYRLTELTYTGELVLNAGSPLTSGYDKIVQMLGNYEYFYDVEGRFVFQKKRNYIDTIWNNKINSGDEIYYTNMTDASPIIYSFEDSKMIQSYQNNPNVQNLKNDYVVWGERKGVSGAAIPIHYRYAIDKKPYKYTNYEGKIFTTKEYNWRELIYQMAQDYMAHNSEDDFYIQIKKNNRGNGTDEDPDLYIDGKTGYEIYYTDILGFWREMYNPKPTEEEINLFYDANAEDPYWNINMLSHPETLNFWLEFLDTEGDLGQYSIGTIGDRIKVVNDKTVKAVHYKEVPELIFITPSEEGKIRAEKDSGYTFVYIQSDLEGMFNISSQGKSAKQAIDDLLYQHLYNSETITLRTLPIYYLQPNCRIYVKNDLSKIDGDYIINKINFNLGNSNMMTISANKAPKRYL